MNARCGLLRVCLTLGLASVLAGCGPYPAKDSGALSLEQRVLELERRVDSLQAERPSASPRRSRAAIQAEISALEQERSRLLTRYYDQHPAIRDIDRRLAILHGELQTLE
jgi:chromosome segregation ATPase